MPVRAHWEQPGLPSPPGRSLGLSLSRLPDCDSDSRSPFVRPAPVPRETGSVAPGTPARAGPHHATLVESSRRIPDQTCYLRSTLVGTSGLAARPAELDFLLCGEEGSLQRRPRPGFTTMRTHKPGWVPSGRLRRRGQWTVGSPTPPSLAAQWVEGVCKLVQQPGAPLWTRSLPRGPCFLPGAPTPSPGPQPGALTSTPERGEEEAQQQRQRGRPHPGAADL